MKKIFLALTILSVALITGCSQPIPPTYVGKILTPSGYQPDVIPPGRVTVTWRNKLILVETGTKTMREPVTIIMQDKLTLSADVRFRVRVNSTDKKVLNSMFNDIRAKDGVVALDAVYSTYGKMVVRNKTREVLSKYTVEDVHKNYARISGEIFNAVTEAMESAPLSVSDVALGNIKYPEVVTKAVNLAKERELQIKQEESQVKIELTKKEGEKRLAEADYQIRMIRAKATRDENRTIAEGISKDLLKLKALEVQEAMAANKSATFVPYESLTNPAMQMRMYSK